MVPRTIISYYGAFLMLSTVPSRDVLTLVDIKRYYFKVVSIYLSIDFKQNPIFHHSILPEHVTWLAVSNTLNRVLLVKARKLF